MLELLLDILKCCFILFVLWFCYNIFDALQNPQPMGAIYAPLGNKSFSSANTQNIEISKIHKFARLANKYFLVENTFSGYAVVKEVSQEMVTNGMIYDNLFVLAGLLPANTMIKQLDGTTAFSL